MNVRLYQELDARDTRPIRNPDQVFAARHARQLLGDFGDGVGGDSLANLRIHRIVADCVISRAHILRVREHYEQILGIPLLDGFGSDGGIGEIPKHAQLFSEHVNGDPGILGSRFQILQELTARVALLFEEGVELIEQEQRGAGDRLTGWVRAVRDAADERRLARAGMGGGDRAAGIEYCDFLLLALVEEGEVALFESGYWTILIADCDFDLDQAGSRASGCWAMTDIRQRPTSEGIAKRDAMRRGYYDLASYVNDFGSCSI